MPTRTPPIDIDLTAPLPAALDYDFGAEQPVAMGMMSAMLQAGMAAQGAVGVSAVVNIDATPAVSMPACTGTRGGVYGDAPASVLHMSGVSATLITGILDAGAPGASGKWTGVISVDGTLGALVQAIPTFAGQYISVARGVVAAQPSILPSIAGRTGTAGSVHSTAAAVAYIKAQQGSQGAVHHALPPFGGMASGGEWDPNVFRGLTRAPREGYQAPSKAYIWHAVPWDYSLRARPQTAEAWADALPISGQAISQQDSLMRSPVETGAVHADATLTSRDAKGPYILTHRRHTRSASVWTPASAITRDCRAPFFRLWRRHRLQQDPWDSGATSTDRCWIAPWALLSRTNRLPYQCRQAPWQDAQRPPFVWPIIVHIPPELPPPFTPGLDFDLSGPPRPPHFYFGVSPEVRRLIIVVHSLQITTLPDGTPIPCDAISLRADRDSWCWGWEASVLKAASELAEQQREVQITVDGNIWTGLVETSRMSRRHGWSATQVGGRSRSAILAAPYTDARSRLEALDRTAVQLAEDELYNTGWTLSWGSVDWLVPGGVFAYDALTPIEAVVKLATAIGSIVQTHPSDPTISVIPRYGVSTWDVPAAAVDWVIPGDIVLDMTVAWRPETLYRGVWVSGQGAGVLARVFRTGTDGAPYKQMVVDPLITHIDAARERGRQILCAGGKRADVTLTLPLSTSVGLIKPGQLVEVTAPAFRGYVDAVSISARRVNVVQTVTIERIDQTP